MKTKQRFVNRIGKRVYRNKTTCNCISCNDVVDNGLIVNDNNHAQYLFDVYNDYNYEVPNSIDYFDKHKK